MSVLIDITTFTHEGLLILVRFLSAFKEKIGNLFFCYTGAEDYDPKQNDPQLKWLTKGIKTIRSVLGFPGVHDPSKPNHLIILFGFESDRTQRLIQNFEFEEVSLGFGAKNSSISNSHYEINRSRHEELLKLYPFAKGFEFSLTDPVAAKSQIVEQIEKLPNHNTVVVPLNNKLSTIGAGLLAIENPRIQLCYVRAHEYNLNSYSTPSEKFFLFKL